MRSEARLKKKTEQLKEGLKAQFWGLKTWGQGGPGPLGPPGSASVYNLDLSIWFAE